MPYTSTCDQARKFSRVSDSVLQSFP
jgi:hypothetical protein